MMHNPFKPFGESGKGEYGNYGYSQNRTYEGKSGGDGYGVAYTPTRGDNGKGYSTYTPPHMQGPEQNWGKGGGGGYGFQGYNTYATPRGDRKYWYTARQVAKHAESDENSDMCHVLLDAPLGAKVHEEGRQVITYRNGECSATEGLKSEILVIPKGYAKRIVRICNVMEVDQGEAKFEENMKKVAGLLRTADCTPSLREFHKMIWDTTGVVMRKENENANTVQGVNLDELCGQIMQRLGRADSNTATQSAQERIEQLEKELAQMKPKKLRLVAEDLTADDDEEEVEVKMDTPASSPPRSRPKRKIAKKK